MHKINDLKKGYEKHNPITGHCEPEGRGNLIAVNCESHKI
jgi:hypothetical protein